MLDSLYFTVETISTVGYGDFSFGAQPTWMRVFGIVLIILGATAITALFALITDLLFSRRVAEAFGLNRVTRMRGHVVVIGLGAVGLRVVEELLRYGLEVVVIESDEQNRHLGQGRALHVPIIVGDATQTQTLDTANVAAASAVAILTSDDLTNLETGLSLREYLTAASREIPIIMRIFDRPLGRVIEESFGFRFVRSTSALAAPWFVGAALGLDILSTFYVEQELLLVACLTVAPAGGLAGLAMQDLSARIRVIAIRRAGGTGLGAPAATGDPLRPRRPGLSHRSLRGAADSCSSATRCRHRPPPPRPSPALPRFHAQITASHPGKLCDHGDLVDQPGAHLGPRESPLAPVELNLGGDRHPSGSVVGDGGRDVERPALAVHGEVAFHHDLVSGAGVGAGGGVGKGRVRLHFEEVGAVVGGCRAFSASYRPMLRRSPGFPRRCRLRRPSPRPRWPGRSP